MWKLRCLTTLWASTAYYRDNFTGFVFTFATQQGAESNPDLAHVIIRTILRPSDDRWLHCSGKFPLELSSQNSHTMLRTRAGVMQFLKREITQQRTRFLTGPRGVSKGVK
jgi:hypothetical protein